MTEKSYPWGGSSIGDCGPYSNEDWSKMYREAFFNYGSTGSALYNIGNMLEVTNPAGATIRVASGIAQVHGVYYANDANVDLTVVQPGSGSNYYRVVLRKTWASQTIRIALTDVSTVSLPAVTQSDGSVWEVSLAGVQITNTGTVTITDERYLIQKLKQIWIGGFSPTATNGCAYSAQIEMGTNKNCYDYLAFDKNTIEYAYANAPLPSDYTGGTIYAQPWWLHPATTTNFKVSWGLQAVCIADDDALDVAQGTAQYSNDTGGTTSDLYVGPVTNAITISGTPTAGKLCNFRASRKADDATNDTLDVDAYLLGFVIWYPVR